MIKLSGLINHGLRFSNIIRITNLPPLQESYFSSQKLPINFTSVPKVMGSPSDLCRQNTPLITDIIPKCTHFGDTGSRQSGHSGKVDVRGLCNHTNRGTDPSFSVVLLLPMIWVITRLAAPSSSSFFVRLANHLAYAQS